MNQPSVLAPTRAIAAPPSMRATPTVSVENTSGAMIILMRRRKQVVTSDRSAAAALRRRPAPSQRAAADRKAGRQPWRPATSHVIRDFIGRFYHTRSRSAAPTSRAGRRRRQWLLTWRHGADESAVTREVAVTTWGLRFRQQLCRAARAFLCAQDPMPVAGPRLIRFKQELAGELGIELAGARCRRARGQISRASCCRRAPSRSRWPMPATSSGSSCRSSATAGRFCWARLTTARGCGATSS